MFPNRLNAKAIIGTAALGTLLFVACSSTVEDAGISAPDQTTELDNTSADADTANAQDNELAGDQISFANDVQPILEQNCVSCHSGTGPGTTHLVMDTAEEIANVAPFAAFRVEERQMPPWPLTGLQEVNFQYDLSMSDEDRQVIIDWAAEGGSLDVDPATPLSGTTQSFAPIDADVVLRPDEPYTGSGEARDDYRCRVIETGQTEDQWATSLQVLPDETRVLHHGLVFRGTSADREIVDRLSAQDELPGWQCQTIPRLSEGTADQIGGWAPGTGPTTFPEGSGLRLAADDFLIIQWHYHYDGEPLPDNSGLAIEYADEQDLADAGGALDPVRTRLLLGPVEIPCASFESGPGCEREAAIQRVAEEFGFESTFLPALINERCGVTPEDFAHFTDGVAQSSCDLNAPTGEVVSIWPHLHELGTTYRLTLNPDTPEERVLIDIDRWNFQWQLGYYPDEELVFESGDRLRLECGWDRALWPADEESRYVVWAEGTADEMCYGAIAISE